MSVDQPSRRELIGFAAVLAATALAWEGWQAWYERSQAQALAEVARPGDIRMISSVTCVFCTRARAWMTRHQVPFQECFIERDAQCRADYEALLAPGTPLLLVRGQRQLGFKPERVAEALARAPTAPAALPPPAASGG